MHFHQYDMNVLYLITLYSNEFHQCITQSQLCILLYRVD